MQNVCITGISGYLGMRLCEELASRKDIGAILGIDIKPINRELQKISFYKKDIRDSVLGDLFAESKIETVFHLAFVVAPIHNKKLMHDIDYNGTKNVLEKAFAAGVKHVVLISSTLAYGAHPDNPEELKEEDPLRGNKRFPYGYNKALVDMMAQTFAKEHPGMIITILRPCTVFGPSVNNYVSRALFRPVTGCIAGHDAKTQFIHEDDFIRACLIAMEKKISGAFNIAGDGTLTTREIAAKIGAKLLAVPAWIAYPSAELLWRLHAPGVEINSGQLDYVRYPFVAGTQKAKDMLGFFPKYSTLQTLEDTIKYKK